MYILECSDGSYYTGSTTNLELRLQQHQSGEGANHTKKRLPVTLVYYEKYSRIDEAFYREKQVQGWSRKKKEALINGNPELLPQLAVAYRDLKNSGGLENLNHKETTVSSRTSDTVVSSASDIEVLRTSDTEVLRTSDTRAISLPEVLEGSDKETLEGSEREALEGSDKETLKDTVIPSKNEYQ